MWKGNRDTTTLLFSLIEVEILYQDGRGQVNTLVMEHFNIILFHKSGPANKQHANQSIIIPSSLLIQNVLVLCLMGIYIL
jgi:hypothetical protein